MQIHIKGVRENEREMFRGRVLACLHGHDINYDYWSWDWEDPVEVTDNDGNIIGEGINVELPGTEAIRKAVPKGLLEDISSAFGGVVVYVVMAPVEASYEGDRL